MASRNCVHARMRANEWRSFIQNGSAINREVICWMNNNLFCGMNTELLTLGENRHATVTLADKLIVTDIDVRRSGTWFAVPKYNGTNASQITHVVYIVKPDSFVMFRVWKNDQNCMASNASVELFFFLFRPVVGFFFDYLHVRMKISQWYFSV